MVSKQPRKKRYELYNLALHKKRKLVNAHLSKALQEKLKKRSAQLKRGDKIKIMRGKFAGKEAKVVKVLITKSKIYLEGIMAKKANKREKFIPFEPSNLLITELGKIAPKEVLIKKAAVPTQ